MKLRERLAELRAGRGYTLRKLRDEIEARTGERMSISYLSELERLDTTPSVEVLSRIAKGYGMSLQDLIQPVVFNDSTTSVHYPTSLIEYGSRYDVSAEDIAALARIEFRGHQPHTVEGWRALHSTLELIRGRTG